jgi:hypothetical protein
MTGPTKARSGGKRVGKKREATQAPDWLSSPAFRKYQAEWNQFTSSPAGRRFAEDAKAMAEHPASQQMREFFAKADRKLQREEAKASAPEAEAPTLKPASKQMIRTVIGLVYDEADTRKEKRPNINELPKPVQKALAAKGYTASGKLIKEIGKPFRNRRGQVGRRWS